MSLEAELYVLDICFEHLELGIICPSDKVYGCLLRVYLAFVENFQHIVDSRRKVHRVVTVGGNQTLSFRQKDAGLLPFNVKIHDELVVILESGEVFQMLVYGGQNTGFRGDGAVSSFPTINQNYLILRYGYRKNFCTLFLREQGAEDIIPGFIV